MEKWPLLEGSPIHRLDLATQIAGEIPGERIRNAGRGDPSRRPLRYSICFELGEQAVCLAERRMRSQICRPAYQTDFFEKS